jgi:hypothetical protein
MINAGSAPRAILNQLKPGCSQMNEIPPLRVAFWDDSELRANRGMVHAFNRPVSNQMKSKKMKAMMKPFTRSHSRCGFFILAVALCWFAFSPVLEAGCPNPPGVCFGQNTAVGEDALFSVTTGVRNAGVGVGALFHTTDGNQNTGIGYQTLFNNISGDHSTGIGSQALFNNTSGSDNVGIGFRTLYTNTSGSRNTGMGYRTLALNDSGNDNTAVGWNALYNNVSSLNTAIGSQALFHNTIGNQNTAVGGAGCCGAALFSNTSGSFNTAVGGGALSNNIIGNDNLAVGSGALQHNIDGDENVAVGLNALNNSTGNNNVALGNLAGFAATDGSNNIYIGNQIEGTAGESNACYIGSIFGQTASGGSAVYIDANGRLGTSTSSKRFKEDIEQMGTISEALFALKPVAFHYKKQIDPTRKSQFGLVAEDVEKANPDLVVLDKEGKPDSVRYDQVNAMLLNEFLKEHKAFLEEQHKVQEQGATIARMEQQIEALTAGLRKISTQLELNKPATRTALNSQ